jgi:diguanylate cyclase (GGDEF)-like protein/PAS domain S-box-containing protein
MIGDVRAAPYASHPAATAFPAVRSYLGVAVELSDGRFYGTLCAADSEPRTLTSHQADLMVVLARLLATQIERDRESAERVALEKLLAEDRFRSLVRNASDAIGIVDASGVVVYQSPAVSHVLGYAPEDLVGGDGFALVHPDSQEWARRRFGEIVRGADPSPSVELQLRHRDGGYRDVEAVVTNLLHDPAVSGVVVNYRDITGRKRDEEALRNSEAGLAAAQRVARLGSWSHDLATGNLHWSDELYRIYALAREGSAPSYEEVAGRIHPQDVERVWRAVADCAAGLTATFDLEHRLVWPDGQERVVHARGETMFDASGGVVRNVGTVLDVTERKRAEEALRESERRLANAQRIAHLGDWEWEVGTGTMLWSNEVYRIFGERPQAFQPTFNEYLKRVHPEDRRLAEVSALDAWRAGKAFSLDYRIVRSDGEVRDVHEEAEITPSAAGGKGGMVGIVYDITERKALEGLLRRQAFHDALTGLPNRALFMDRLEHALARAAPRSASVAVLFADLDGFKYVNDSLGHQAGDRLLGAVARRLAGCARPEDTVARLGGDEFAVLLEEASDDTAVGLAQRLVECLQAPFPVSDKQLTISASIGVALHRPSAGEPADLLREADIAMYRAKGAGKGRYQVFDARMGHGRLARVDREGQLRLALERGQFELRYQPQVRLSSGRIEAVEALVRWAHPWRGLLAPTEFVPLAEETGLILPIGRWALRAACARARAWRDGQKSGPPLLVSVNLSARQLADPGFVRYVAGTLREAGLEPEALQLELTESAVMEDGDSTTATIRGLRALGVRLAVDDFGTGYSSLSHLRYLPADTLKIDKGFVEGLGREPRDTALVGSIVELAHALGMGVVAEGVETPEQLARLRALGCDLGQGHIFAPPLPSDAVEEWLPRVFPVATASPGAEEEGEGVAQPPAG